MHRESRATTIPQYAKSVGFHIVGKLTRVVANKNDVKKLPLWVDEAGNEFMGNARDGFCIVTTEGNVI